MNLTLLDLCIVFPVSICSPYPLSAMNRNAVTRADVRDVLMRRDASTAFNHNYSVKIGQVQNTHDVRMLLRGTTRAHAV